MGDMALVEMKLLMKITSDSTRSLIIDPVRKSLAVLFQKRYEPASINSHEICHACFTINTLANRLVISRYLPVHKCYVVVGNNVPNAQFSAPVLSSSVSAPWLYLSLQLSAALWALTLTPCSQPYLDTAAAPACYFNQTPFIHCSTAR